MCWFDGAVAKSPPGEHGRSTGQSSSLMSTATATWSSPGTGKTWYPRRGGRSREGVNCRGAFEPWAQCVCGLPPNARPRRSTPPVPDRRNPARWSRGTVRADSVVYGKYWPSVAETVKTRWTPRRVLSLPTAWARGASGCRPAMAGEWSAWAAHGARWSRSCSREEPACAPATSWRRLIIRRHDVSLPAPVRYEKQGGGWGSAAMVGRGSPLRMSVITTSAGSVADGFRNVWMWGRFVRPGS